MDSNERVVPLRVPIRPERVTRMLRVQNCSSFKSAFSSVSLADCMDLKEDEATETGGERKAT